LKKKKSNEQAVKVVSKSDNKTLHTNARFIPKSEMCETEVGQSATKRVTCEEDWYFFTLLIVYMLPARSPRMLNNRKNTQFIVSMCKVLPDERFNLRHYGQKCVIEACMHFDFGSIGPWCGLRYILLDKSFSNEMFSHLSKLDVGNPVVNFLCSSKRDYDAVVICQTKALRIRIFVFKELNSGES
jgi:hypothetical protein